MFHYFPWFALMMFALLALGLLRGPRRPIGVAPKLRPTIREALRGRVVDLCWFVGCGVGFSLASSLAWTLLREPEALDPTVLAVCVWLVRAVSAALVLGMIAFCGVVMHSLGREVSYGAQPAPDAGSVRPPSTGC